MAIETYKVGDIVALVSCEGSGNGAGEGILWRVTKVTIIGNNQSNYQVWQKLRVEPCWCATGCCSLRPKTVYNTHIRQRLDFLRLGELRMQLDDLCRTALAHEAGLMTEPVKQSKT
jgi:hypothetical protein